MKYKRALPILIFFILIFILSIRPLRDYDIWFHLKSGEVLSKLGLIHHDVFSYNSQGREWFPYEWAFQILVYQTGRILGLESIKYLIALLITITTFLIFLTLRKISKLNLPLSLGMSFYFLISIYEFITARPHVFAYAFLLFNLFFILKYFQQQKPSIKPLLITLPITLIWSNLHGSIFLDIYLFLAYAFFSLINYLLTRHKYWLTKFLNLGLFGLISAALSILPPIGTLQYRLLYMFFIQREFISRFIDEWTPLNVNPFAFIFYSISLIIIFLLWFFLIYKRRDLTSSFWLLPLIPFPFLAYVASRNVFLGYITLTLMAGFTLSHLPKLKPRPYALLIGLGMALLLFHLWILTQKRIPQKLYYPVNAVNFIKTYDLTGHMFNEYGYGGYLLYHLYPQKQIFYDGRTDVYLCCEMPDTLGMATNKNLPDDQYKDYLDHLWNKYQISYVLLRTEKHTVIRKIAKILSQDPNWSLVFWDDYSVIYVRHDGKNDQLITDLGAKVATPYNRDPFLKDKQDTAMLEYQRMVTVADSGHSRNAIGYIYLLSGEYDFAKTQFELAASFDPSFESPLMNLAELSAKDGDLIGAINLYKQAQKLAIDRGLIYIRLGQLFEQSGQPDQAIISYKTGIKNTVDADAKQKLKSLLQQATSR